MRTLLFRAKSTHDLPMDHRWPGRALTRVVIGQRIGPMEEDKERRSTGAIAVEVSRLRSLSWTVGATVVWSRLLQQLGLRGAAGLRHGRHQTNWPKGVTISQYIQVCVTFPPSISNAVLPGTVVFLPLGGMLPPEGAVSGRCKCRGRPSSQPHSYPERRSAARQSEDRVVRRRRFSRVWHSLAQPSLSSQRQTLH